MSNPGPKSTRRKPAAPSDVEQPAADAPEAVATGKVLRADVIAELAKLRTIRDEVKGLTDEATERLDNVRAAVAEGKLPAGEYTDAAGNKVLTLSRPESWDQATAEARIPASFRPLCTRRTVSDVGVEAALANGTITREQYDAITVEVLDKAKAKDNLPPVVYKTCLVPAANPTVKPA